MLRDWSNPLSICCRNSSLTLLGLQRMKLMARLLLSSPKMTDKLGVIKKIYRLIKSVMGDFGDVSELPLHVELLSFMLNSVGT